MHKGRGTFLDDFTDWTLTHTIQLCIDTQNQ